MSDRRPLISGKDLTIGVLIAALVYVAASEGKIVVQPVIDLSKLKGGSGGSTLSTIGQALLSS